MLRESWFLTTQVESFSVSVRKGGSKCRIAKLLQRGECVRLAASLHGRIQPQLGFSAGGADDELGIPGQTELQYIGGNEAGARADHTPKSPGTESKVPIEAVGHRLRIIFCLVQFSNEVRVVPSPCQSAVKFCLIGHDNALPMYVKCCGSQDRF